MTKALAPRARYACPWQMAPRLPSLASSLSESQTPSNNPQHTFVKYLIPGLRKDRLDAALLSVTKPLSPKMRRRARRSAVRQKYPCRMGIDRCAPCRQESSRTRNFRSISIAMISLRGRRDLHAFEACPLCYHESSRAFARLGHRSAEGRLDTSAPNVRFGSLADKAPTCPHVR